MYAIKNMDVLCLFFLQFMAFVEKNMGWKSQLNEIL